MNAAYTKASLIALLDSMHKNQYPAYNIFENGAGVLCIVGQSLFQVVQTVIAHFCSPHIQPSAIAVPPLLFSSLADAGAALHQGYLSKIGDRVKSIKKRFFVLRAFTLSYYPSQHDAKPLGEISLSSATLVPIATPGPVTSSRPREILLDVPGRRYILFADTDAEDRVWRSCLEAAIARCAQKNRKLGASVWRSLKNPQGNWRPSVPTPSMTQTSAQLSPLDTTYSMVPLPPLNRISFIGFLTKLGHNVRNWKRRLFLLSNKTLLYFKPVKQAGTINLEEAEIALGYDDSVVIPPNLRDFSFFRIVTVTRTYHFCHASKELALRWMYELRQEQLRPPGTSLVDMAINMWAFTHQPQFSLQRPLRFSGFLSKRGNRVGEQQWMRLFAAVCPPFLMCYQSPVRDEKLRINLGARCFVQNHKSLELHMRSPVEYPMSRLPDDSASFSLLSSDMALLFRCTSPAEALVWINELATEIARQLRAAGTQLRTALTTTGGLQRLVCAALSIQRRWRGVVSRARLIATRLAGPCALLTSTAPTPYSRINPLRLLVAERQSLTDLHDHIFTVLRAAGLRTPEFALGAVVNLDARRGLLVSANVTQAPAPKRAVVPGSVADSAAEALAQWSRSVAASPQTVNTPSVPVGAVPTREMLSLSLSLAVDGSPIAAAARQQSFSPSSRSSVSTDTLSLATSSQSSPARSIPSRNSSSASLRGLAITDSSGESSAASSIRGSLRAPSYRAGTSASSSVSAHGDSPLSSLPRTASASSLPKTVVAAAAAVRRSLQLPYEVPPQEQQPTRELESPTLHHVSVRKGAAVTRKLSNRGSGTFYLSSQPRRTSFMVRSGPRSVELALVTAYRPVTAAAGANSILFRSDSTEAAPSDFAPLFWRAVVEPHSDDPSNAFSPHLPTVVTLFSLPNLLSAKETGETSELDVSPPPLSPRRCGVFLTERHVALLGSSHAHLEQLFAHFAATFDFSAPAAEQEPAFQDKLGAAAADLVQKALRLPSLPVLSETPSVSRFAEWQQHRPILWHKASVEISGQANAESLLMTQLHIHLSFHDSVPFEATTFAVVCRGLLCIRLPPNANESSAPEYISLSLANALFSRPADIATPAGEQPAVRPPMLLLSCDAASHWRIGSTSHAIAWWEPLAKANERAAAEISAALRIQALLRAYPRRKAWRTLRPTLQQVLENSLTAGLFRTQRRVLPRETSVLLSGRTPSCVRLGRTVYLDRERSIVRAVLEEVEGMAFHEVSLHSAVVAVASGSAVFLYHHHSSRPAEWLVRVIETQDAPETKGRDVSSAIEPEFGALILDGSARPVFFGDMDTSPQGLSQARLLWLVLRAIPLELTWRLRPRLAVLLQFTRPAVGAAAESAEASKAQEMDIFPSSDAQRWRTLLSQTGYSRSAVFVRRNAALLCVHNTDTLSHVLPQLTAGNHHLSTAPWWENLQMTTMLASRMTVHLSSMTVEESRRTLYCDVIRTVLLRYCRADGLSSVEEWQLRSMISGILNAFALAPTEHAAAILSVFHGTVSKLPSFESVMHCAEDTSPSLSGFSAPRWHQRWLKMRAGKIYVYKNSDRSEPVCWFSPMSVYQVSVDSVWPQTSVLALDFVDRRRLLLTHKTSVFSGEGVTCSVVNAWMQYLIISRIFFQVLELLCNLYPVASLTLPALLGQQWKTEDGFLDLLLSVEDSDSDHSGSQAHTGLSGQREAPFILDCESVTDSHHAFLILLSVLTTADLIGKERQKEWVPLSQFSEQLLALHTKRYGLTPTYCSIALFFGEVWRVQMCCATHITHIVFHLEALTISLSSLTLSIIEEQLFREALIMLYSAIDDQFGISSGFYDDDGTVAASEIETALPSLILLLSLSSPAFAILTNNTFFLDLELFVESVRGAVAAFFSALLRSHSSLSGPARIVAVASAVQRMLEVLKKLFGRFSANKDSAKAQKISHQQDAAAALSLKPDTDTSVPDMQTPPREQRRQTRGRRELSLSLLETLSVDSVFQEAASTLLSELLAQEISGLQHSDVVSPLESCWDILALLEILDKLDGDHQAAIADAKRYLARALEQVPAITHKWVANACHGDLLQPISSDTRFSTSVPDIFSAIDTHFRPYLTLSAPAVAHWSQQSLIVNDRETSICEGILSALADCTEYYLHCLLAICTTEPRFSHSPATESRPSPAAVTVLSAPVTTQSDSSSPRLGLSKLRRTSKSSDRLAPPAAAAPAPIVVPPTTSEIVTERIVPSALLGFAPLSDFPGRTFALSERLIFAELARELHRQSQGGPSFAEERLHLQAVCLNNIQRSATELARLSDACAPHSSAALLASREHHADALSHLSFVLVSKLADWIPAKMSTLCAELDSAVAAGLGARSGWRPVIERLIQPLEPALAALLARVQEHMSTEVARTAVGWVFKMCFQLLVDNAVTPLFSALAADQDPAGLADFFSELLEDLVELFAAHRLHVADQDAAIAYFDQILKCWTLPPDALQAFSPDPAAASAASGGESQDGSISTLSVPERRQSALGGATWREESMILVSGLSVGIVQRILEARSRVLERA
eukprot:TRINITY_DN2612_c0_g1_i9.p1 TRINITY_DN2612_c0_g1~~TRINITY_DN2612_c0_g1_i9.p1  ORF type:complete len:2755 (-),score=553.61 TRINITY_DN2612_c0_g1_i9:25-7650(-)